MDDYNETTLYEEDTDIEIDNVPKRRIDKWEFYLMLMVAVFIDSAQIAILVVFTTLGAGPIGLAIAKVINTIIWVIGWIIFTIWFQLKNLRFLEKIGRKALVFFLGGILDGLPDFTVLVIMVYIETKVLDEKKIKKFEKILDYLESL